MALANWDLSDEEGKPAVEKQVKKVKSAKKPSKRTAMEGKEQTDNETNVKKRKKSVGKSEAVTAAKTLDESAEAEAKPAKRKKLPKSVSETDQTDKADKKDKPAKKGKFRVSAEGGSVDGTKPVPDETESAGASQADLAESEEQKKKAKKMAATKRKALKSKDRKRKKKINDLKSKMPKSELEEYLKPKIPDEPPQQAALNYLRLWKKTRAAWKFSKVRQIWLLKNMYKAGSVTDADFEMLLEYLEPLSGNAKSQTLKEAAELLELHKDATVEDNMVLASRAKQILQAL